MVGQAEGVVLGWSLEQDVAPVRLVNEGSLVRVVLNSDVGVSSIVRHLAHHLVCRPRETL